MWTRMREHLAATGVDPADCLYVCGAFHAASRVARVRPGRTRHRSRSPRAPATKWLYGLIPSSHSAIEAQFGLASGSVSIAAAHLGEGRQRGSASTPFRLDGQRGRRRSEAARQGRRAGRRPAPVADQLTGFLASPPALDAARRGGAARLVRRHRAAGPPQRLPGQHRRRHRGVRDVDPAGRHAQPGPAHAVRLPGRGGHLHREGRRCPAGATCGGSCEILLGGDRVGQVGYDALPPAGPRRLRPARPARPRPAAARPCSGRCSTSHGRPGARAAAPTCCGCCATCCRTAPSGPSWASAGSASGRSRRAGTWRSARTSARSSSWATRASPSSRSWSSGCAGRVYAPDATAAVALAAVEDAILFLGSRRFTDELGARAVELLAAERTVDDAPGGAAPDPPAAGPLPHHRAGAAGVERVVRHRPATRTTAPCCRPRSSTTRPASGRSAAMLGFLFTMESLALSLGCDRAQLETRRRAVAPGGTGRRSPCSGRPTHQLGLLPLADLRARCAELLANPLVVPAFPHYLSGFVQALEPVPGLAAVRGRGDVQRVRPPARPGPAAVAARP